MGCYYWHNRISIRTIVTLPVMPPTMLAQNVIGSAFSMRFRENHIFLTLSPPFLCPTRSAWRLGTGEKIQDRNIGEICCLNLFGFPEFEFGFPMRLPVSCRLLPVFWFSCFYSFLLSQRRTRAALSFCSALGLSVSAFST